ncbi:MAG: tetratricopeptide repeat protein [Acidobacteriia bacterium]|nr:tetratricopeptide repeat protein [Terriglobia bacterium]
MARNTISGCASTMTARRRCYRIAGPLLAAFLIAAGIAAPCRARQTARDWQAEVRNAAAAHDWAGALRIVDGEIARAPKDMDIRAWRARVLLWAGRLTEAEREFAALVQAVPNDPDDWMGLGTVYLQQRRLPDALRAMDRAVALDPKRSDLRAARARVLVAMGEPRQARLEFQQVLRQDPANVAARDELASLRNDTKHQLRFGAENDLFNFTGANHSQWLSLISRWSPRWTTSAAGNFYQIAGVGAGKFTGGVTRTAARWGSLTIGGAVARDNAVVPRAEAFFAADRGWAVSQDNVLRGIELTYGQHWYWYATARILTFDETAFVYLPREWSWSIRLTQARSQFPATPADWKPSGMTRLAFPLTHAGARRLLGNIFFAAGTEDFAQISQIGSFASQTYGGGFRFQLNARHDITGYASYQRRTRNRTDTNFGVTYGIRF